MGDIMARATPALTAEAKEARKQLRAAARTLFDLLDLYSADGLDNRWVQGQIKGQWRRYKEAVELDRIYRSGRRTS